MAVIAFGDADSGAGLMAAGLAGWRWACSPTARSGCWPRRTTPWATAARRRSPRVGSAVAGVAFMVVAHAATHGSARIFALGLGHTRRLRAGLVGAGRRPAIDGRAWPSGRGSLPAVTAARRRRRRGGLGRDGRAGTPDGRAVTAVGRSWSSDWSPVRSTTSACAACICFPDRSCGPRRWLREACPAARLGAGRRWLRAGRRRPRHGRVRPGAERVLVFSLPTVSWAEANDFDLPHLSALLDESAIGGLSTRAVDRRTTPGDGYTTLNAGTRAGRRPRVRRPRVRGGRDLPAGAGRAGVHPADRHAGRARGCSAWACRRCRTGTRTSTSVPRSARSGMRSETKGSALR